MKKLVIEQGRTVPRVKLPTIKFNRFPPLDRYQPKQMFGLRILKSLSLLQLPDVGDGTLDFEQRQKWLAQIVEHTALPALTLFQGVVALEDYIRELSNGLGAFSEDLNKIKGIFQIENLSENLKVGTPDEIWESREQLKAMLKPNKVNKRFKDSIGIEPLSSDNRLKDLIILRHIIAHNASNLRKIDVERFQYYEAEENHIFTPTTQFTRENLNYLTKVVREFQEAIWNRILKLLKDSHSKEEFENSLLVKNVITLFEYPSGNLDQPPENLEFLSMRTQEEELRDFDSYQKKLLQNSIVKLSQQLYPSNLNKS